MDKTEILNIVNEPSKHIQIVKIDGKDSIVYSSKFVELLELIPTMLTKTDMEQIRAEIMQLYKRIYDHRHEIILTEDSEYKRGLLSFSDWVLDLMTSNFDYEYKEEINLQEIEDDIEDEEQAESGSEEQENGTNQ